MSYDAHISITVPASMADVASMVGRAFDPDVGGAESFTRDVLGYVDGEPVYTDTITCSTVCRSPFKAQALVMLADPIILFYACQSGYSKRWPDLVAPTLKQCQDFVKSAIIE